MPNTTTLPAPETVAPQRTAPAVSAYSGPAARPTRDREPRLGGMLGRSRVMRELFRRLERASRDASPVLLEGQTGVGKDLAAQTLHALAFPPAALFLTFDPAAGPPAAADAVGGGTLFVEEVGELPAEAQLELWRYLAAPGLRVVCATARDLRAEVERGRFRPDLYRPLRMAAISVPSLRERREDLPLLIDHFLAAACRRHDKRLPGLRRDTLELLLAHSWDGNVRELRNELERAVLLTPEGEEVRPHALSPDLTPAAPLAGAAPGSLRQRSRELEKKMVEQALARNGWNVAATARELGISRVGLSKKLRALEMQRPSRWRPEGLEL
ncbi:MAG TPA: sigma 54-interacting transcriptional regulator [Thermoanaerobaculia bacterium]|nr:sigma 54-interacting transcriptional regulator [Thermoanaerobaculia bacterium]